MIDSKLTKAQLTANLIKAEQAGIILQGESYNARKALDEYVKMLETRDREVEDLQEKLSNIRQSIETSQAVCYPEQSLHENSQKDDPKEFLLLKYIYNTSI